MGANVPDSLTLTERQKRRRETRTVIRMAIPVVILTSSRALMDIADYVMITWLPTDDAQAAILPAQILMWSYIVMGLGIVSMVNTFVSQSLGRKEYRECSAYAWQSVYLGVAFGLIGAAMTPLVPWLVHRIGHEPRVQAAEIAYLRIAMLTVGGLRHSPHRAPGGETTFAAPPRGNAVRGAVAHRSDCLGDFRQRPGRI